MYFMRQINREISTQRVILGDAHLEEGSKYDFTTLRRDFQGLKGLDRSECHTAEAGS